MARRKRTTGNSKKAPAIVMLALDKLCEEQWSPRPHGEGKEYPHRVSIHERLHEADGTRFGDWEMGTIIGKAGRGAILTLTERSTNMIFMEKLRNWKEPNDLVKAVIRFLYPYRGKGVRTITTDNGSEFCAHETIEKALGTTVYFADSYASWQKGAGENANKLIRLYIPKGTDSIDVSEKRIKMIQAKINKRSREKLGFDTPPKRVLCTFLINCTC